MPLPKPLLIVDDESDIRESLHATLSMTGYQVLTAASGEEGLAKAQKDIPDLIILDVMLPHMSGFDVCRKLKSSPATKHIPVILLTALQDVEDKVQGLEAGADDFIPKPFTSQELLARVRAFLRTKYLRDELEASYKKLKELESLRDSLTNMIVHDIRSPLTSILGNMSFIIDELRNGADVPENAKKLLETAALNYRHLMNLIDTFLEVYRMENQQLPLKKTKVSLVKIIETCLSILEPDRRKKEIVFETVFPKEPEPVLLDKKYIQRLLINLLSNSLKFTPRGGKITVAVKTLSAGGQVEVVIEDTGVGIPEENLEKIFQKFFQGKPGRRGQGLGLTFCRMAVEAHGGKIWAERGQKEGSRFIFRLPLS
ncbi:MAG: response regulator [Elusimicrobia bacterium]|nr:response regulator [Elusimicrobiota bacterium]